MFVPNKLFKRVLFFVITALIFCGCFVPTHTHLINNSEQDIAIASYPEEIESFPESKMTAVDKNETVETVVRNGLTIIIIKGINNLRYDGRDIPGEYTEQTGIIWIKRIRRLQLEPDGRIYVLEPGSSIPAKEFPPQPLDYPLVPEVAENPYRKEVPH